MRLCASEKNLAPSLLHPPINCRKTAVKSPLLFFRLSKWIYSASCISPATTSSWFAGLAAVYECLSPGRHCSLHPLSSVFTGGQWFVPLSCWLPSCSGSLGCSWPPLLPGHIADSCSTWRFSAKLLSASPWSELLHVDALFQVQGLALALDLHGILLAHLLQLIEVCLNSNPALQFISRSFQFHSLVFLAVLIEKPFLLLLLVYFLAEFWIS